MAVPMDMLALRTWTGGAPDLASSICTLDGIADSIISLKSQEGKAAFLIWATAVQLQKADGAINQATSFDYENANDLPFHLMKLDYPENPPMFGILPQHLGQFEDLYYAAAGKLKQMIQTVDIMITNNFRAESDTYFVYATAPLDKLGPISLGAFKAFLMTQSEILFDEDLFTILNDGVRVMSTRKTLGKKVRYLQDVEDMTSGMIFGILSEKHMCKEANIAQEMISQKQVNGAGNQAAKSQDEVVEPYVSKYNLDKRGEILEAADRAELPCICDHDCVCYQLCQSDLTQNCLCEENALFARVTEGANIDELDVPDLIRRKDLDSDEYSDDYDMDEEESDMADDDQKSVASMFGEDKDNAAETQDGGHTWDVERAILSPAPSHESFEVNTPALQEATIEEGSNPRAYDSGNFLEEAVADEDVYMDSGTDDMNATMIAEGVDVSDVDCMSPTYQAFLKSSGRAKDTMEQFAGSVHDQHAYVETALGDMGLHMAIASPFNTNGVANDGYPYGTPAAQVQGMVAPVVNHRNNPNMRISTRASIANFFSPSRKAGYKAAVELMESLPPVNPVEAAVFKPKTSSFGLKCGISSMNFLKRSSSKY